MGYVSVQFLGEEYQIPEAINDFLHYDELLTPIRVKIIQRLSQDIRKDALQLTFGDKIPDYFENNANVYKNFMKECADALVNKLFSIGVYDVTANELLDKASSIADIDELKMKTMNDMLAEGRKFVEYKKAGAESAYRSAASKITGSGVMVFSSSISTLMIHSAVERKILLSQARKADKEYEEALALLTQKTMYALDKMVREITVKQYYPALMDILLSFDTKIMSAFLVELTTHEKFDFESVKSYNMSKASAMLENILSVPNKQSLLKQAFLKCPFCEDIYTMCLEQGMLDGGTFETAKYFGFAEELSERIYTYIKDNLNQLDKTAPLVTILAEYQGVDKAEVLKTVYQNTLDKIKETYNEFRTAISDRYMLAGFIKSNVSSQIVNSLDKSRNDIISAIDRKLNQAISQRQYDEFVNMGILSAEEIRLDGSSAVALSVINYEIRSAIVDCIMDYLAEVKQRYDRYNSANEQYRNEIQKLEKELYSMKSEMKQLGLFAFSKKKELSVAISNKEIAIQEYKKQHEPLSLKKEFELMC